MEFETPALNKNIKKLWVKIKQATEKRRYQVRHISRGG